MLVLELQAKRPQLVLPRSGATRLGQAALEPGGSAIVL